MRVLYVYCHPLPESFHSALRERALTALTAAGHAVDLLDLYAEQFDPVLSGDERRRYHDLDRNRQGIETHVARLQAAEALILQFPTWCFGPPAMLKGWLDRLIIPGVAFDLSDPASVKPMLGNVRRLAGIVTYGRSRWHAWYMGDPPRKLFTRYLRWFVGRDARVGVHALYDMNTATAVRREAFLGHVERTMGRLVMRILVVHAHPVAESFSTALFRCVVDTLEAQRHEVDALDLYATGFDPVLSRQERIDYHTSGRNGSAVAREVAQIQWAEGLILVYPTWWYSQPAMLKGWLDRVWLPGVAFRLPADGGNIQPTMRHFRLLGGVTTYGSPWLLIRWVGDPGRRVIMSGLRPLCARQCRTFWLGHYRMDSSTPQSRAAFLERVRAKMARLPR